MFLVCLLDECHAVNHVEETPEEGVCPDCEGPAVWYTDKYWLDYIKSTSGELTLRSGSDVFSYE